MALRQTGLLALAGIWLLLVLFVGVMAGLLYPCSYVLDQKEEGFRLIPQTCFTNIANGVYDWRVLLIPAAGFLLLALGALFVHYLAREIGLKVAEEMPLHRFARSLNDFSKRLDETTASFPTGHVEQKDGAVKRDSGPFIYLRDTDGEQGGPDECGDETENREPDGEDAARGRAGEAESRDG